MKLYVLEVKWVDSKKWEPTVRVTLDTVRARKMLDREQTLDMEKGNKYRIVVYTPAGRFV